MRLLAPTALAMFLVASSAMTSSAKDAATPEIARDFSAPFEYTIPSTIEPSAVEERSVLFGIAEGTRSKEAWGDAQGDAGYQRTAEPGSRGVIVVDVTDAVTHPCNPAYRNRDPLADTPEGFLEDMQTNACLVLEGLSETTFDGRPALVADSRENGSPGSGFGKTDIHLDGRDVGNSDYVVMDTSRLILTEVAGSTIMIEAWALTPEDLEVWLPIAQEFIDSIHFVDVPEASPAPG